QTIEMYETMVDFQGRQVAAIRVHINRTQPAQPLQQAAPPPPADAVAPVSNGHSPTPSSIPVGSVVDDEIPF
ncbi:MAG: hypothetical protein AAFV45_15750, partial [Pseudomonadota bacterium]